MTNHDEHQPGANPGLETWAVIELFGHSKIAGLLVERQIAGEGFLEVVVPQLEDGTPGFSRVYHPNAIYSFTPVSEDVARAAARAFAPRPLGMWTHEITRQLPPPPPTIDEEAPCDEFEDLPEDAEGYE